MTSQPHILCNIQLNHQYFLQGDPLQTLSFHLIGRANDQVHIATRNDKILLYTFQPVENWAPESLLMGLVTRDPSFFNYTELPNLDANVSSLFYSAKTLNANETIRTEDIRAK